MDLEREKRLNDLLVQALDRPAAQRRAFLAEACGGDTDLLEEILACLGQETRLGDFLERPALAGMPAAEGGVGPSPPLARMGRYRILERIGSGGMGEVYRAEDTRLGRTVALKFLRRELTGHREAKARFLREAAAAAQLDHPNICTIHEVGETGDGQLYIVMACYEGESLKDRIRRGPLALGEAVRIARRVAAALGRAHREGIVHRDVKPANVFLTGDDPASPGSVKVLDFGVAKVRGGTALTGTGGLVGTLSYMAPEQIAGSADHRSDIWALGVMLYEMLTGKRPFTGPLTVKAVIQDPVPPLADKRPDLPEAVRRVVERALAKSPEARYQSAGELAADLPFTAGDVLLEPPAAVPPPWRRRGLRLLAAALAAVALALGGLYRLRRAADAPVPGAARAPSVVAVLPFAVRGGGGYAYLGEGMVDLLSTKLDGAGGVRAVDPRALLRRLEAEPIDAGEPRAAAGFARRLDADLLVLGNVVEVAGTLQVDAVLYGAADGVSEIATATASGAAPEIFAMVDGLAAQLLAALDRGAAARMGRLAARTTESFSALKLYLEGEDLWRAGRFADAAGAFEAAVAEDPEFALAWYRLSSARNWLLDPAGAAVALEHAMTYADRLGPDDRRVLAAVDAYNHGDAATAARLCRDVLSRRGDDLEAWKALGEVGFHLEPLFGRSLRHSRHAWERVVELEPDDLQAHLHLARLDLYEGHDDDLARRSELLESLLAGSERSIEPLLFRAMIPGNEAHRRPALDRLLGTEFGLPWFSAGFTYAAGRQARDFWSSFFEALLAPGREPREQAFAHRHLGVLALAEGRLAAADRHLAAAARQPEGDQGYGALAATLPFLPVSGERLRARIAEVEAWPAKAASTFSLFEPHAHVAAHYRLYVLALLVSRAGDADRAAALAGELAALGEVAGAPGLVRDLELGVRADVAWRAGRHREVVDLLAERHGRYGYEATLMSPLFSRSRERYLMAESLDRLGRLEEAADWYETLSETAVFDVVYLAVSHRRRAEIRRRLGHPGLAAEHARRAAELWRDADPELRPAAAGDQG